MSSDSIREQRIAQLKQWEKENPDDPFAGYALALEMRATGNLLEAQDHLTKLCTDFPNYMPAFQMVGIILLEREKLDAAKEYFLKAKEIATKENDTKAVRELNDFLLQIQIHNNE